MICKLLGHKFHRKEQVDYLCYGKVEYNECIRCGSK